MTLHDGENLTILYSCNNAVFLNLITLSTFDSLRTIRPRVWIGKRRHVQRLAIFQDHAYGSKPTAGRNSGNTPCWKARAAIRDPIFLRSTQTHCSMHDGRDGRERRQRPLCARTSEELRFPLPASGNRGTSRRLRLSRCEARPCADFLNVSHSQPA